MVVNDAGITMELGYGSVMRNQKNIQQNRKV
jgi:hypothetical protein